MCAEELIQWSWEDLLNYFLSGIMNQQLGQWRDEWNPHDLLWQNDLDCLIGYDTVRAVSDDPRGDPGDILIFADKTPADPTEGQRQEFIIPIQQGRAFLTGLQADLQQVFRTPGNTHWGDSTDASLLAQALNVGFFIFADRLQRQNQACLCSLTLERGNFPYFLAIWWDEPIHFRSFEVKHPNTNALQSCWAASEVPPFFREQYNLMNPTAPIP